MSAKLLTLRLRRYGEIESIRVLHERFCAFVNFKSATMAAHAMEKLNVSTSLVDCLFYKGHLCSLQVSSHRVIVLKTRV